MFLLSYSASIISIHSVARPRHLHWDMVRPFCCISIHSVARPRHLKIENSITLQVFQSTRSQDRDRSTIFNRPDLYYLNPLGRKTETTLFYFIGNGYYISIHSVARPRHNRNIVFENVQHFNPLGRKTETFPHLTLPRFPDYFNPLGRKTETAKLNNY